MAYFSSGSEGMDARELCLTCVHDGDHETSPGCPVWGLHLDWNYEACDDKTKRHALNTLWPDGGDCAMFVRQDQEVSEVMNDD